MARPEASDVMLITGASSGFGSATARAASAAGYRVALATLERFGRIDVAFANAGFGARRGFLEESPEDVARAVMCALGHPPHVDVNEILMRPAVQEL